MAVSLLALAACAPKPAPAPPPPPPVVVAPAPAPMPMPMPPNSASPTLVYPGTDAVGRRLTPNIDLSPDQALWQLRIGLNVAALNCRGPNEGVLVANYTSFLNANRRAIAAAERWVIRDQGVRTGTNGIAARDALSTRLYNYFAQPPVLGAFCERATAIMALASVEPTATILPFAAAQLPLLDQPFVDFYAAYDRYRTDYARWYAMQPPGTATPPFGVVPGVTPLSAPAPAPLAAPTPLAAPVAGPAAPVTTPATTVPMRPATGG